MANPQFFLFYGPDDYLKTEAAKKEIDARIPPAERDFGLDIISGTAKTGADAKKLLETATDSFYSQSFFGGGKVVWIRDMNFLPGSKERTATSQESKDAIEIFMARIAKNPPPEGNTLIITSTGLNKTTKLAKFFIQNGQILECGADLKPWEIEKAAKAKVKSLLPNYGLSMNEATLAIFAGKIGTDTRTVVSELEKLRTYLGREGEVSSADVNAITSSSVSDNLMEIRDAFGERNPVKIVKLIKQYKLIKGAEFIVCSSLISYINDLIILRESFDNGSLNESGWQTTAAIEGVATRVGSLAGFMLSKQLRSAKNFSLQELRAARFYVIELRYALVSSITVDSWTIIETYLLRAIMRSAKRR